MPPNLLEAYSVLWCLQWSVSLWRYPEYPEVVALPLVLFLLLFHRDSLSLLISAHVLFIATKCLRQPFQYNSDVWCGLVDIVVVARSAIHILKRGWPRSVARKNELVREAASSGKDALGVLYFAAGFYKFNTSHLSPKTSCSTIFFSSLIYEYLGFWPATAAAVSTCAGWVTAILETIIGLLLLRGNALLGVLLHVSIALTPEPNNIAAFGAMMVPRFWFVNPVPLAHQQTFILLLSLIESYSGLVLGLAIILISPVATIKRRIRHKTDWMVVAAVALYTSLPVFGLMDMGNCHMFANFRVVGGSNHLFLPSGLFQAWRLGGPESPFAGGVVMIHNTTNSRIAKMYPCEMSHYLRHPARQLMRSAAGHSGREFIPLEARIYGGEGICGEATEQVPYLTHALELRRLIKESEDDRDFYITYRRLPDNAGLLQPPNDDNLLQLRVDETGLKTCANIRTGEPCPRDAPSELGWPARRSLTWWIVSKLLVFNPQPLIGNSETECCDG